MPPIPPTPHTPTTPPTPPKPPIYHAPPSNVTITQLFIMFVDSSFDSLYKTSDSQLFNSVN